METSVNRLMAAAIVGLALALTHPGEVSAAEINIWTARAITTVLAEIGHQFEGATGHTLTVVSGLPTDFARRAAAGETFDVLISGSASVARKPDIGSVEALKRLLLQSKSVAYSAQVSGAYLSMELFPRLGIADQMAAKSVRVEREPVGNVVARGEAEIGFQQISELLPIPGITYVGPLPPDVQRVTVFSAGVVVGSRNPDAARAFIRFFVSPAGVRAMKSSGLEPISPKERGRD